MRKLVTQAIGAMLVCTLLPSGGFAARALAAEELSGETLRKQIPGSKIHIDTPLGSVVPVAYSADGTLEGKAGAVAFFLGSQKDRGKWWIEGSKLCQRWNTWFNGRVNCARVYRTAENRIEWIDQDGEKGTGTVVEFSQSTLAKAAINENSVKQTAAANSSASPPPKPAPVATPANIARPAPVAKFPSAQSTTAREAATLKPPAPVQVRGPVPPNPEKRLVPQPATPNKPVRTAEVHHPEKVAATPAPAATYRVVNVPFDDVLNVRVGPGPETMIVSTIRPRSKGILIAGSCAGDWCPIRHGQAQGWVNRYFLASESGSRYDFKARQPKPNPITYKVVGVPAGDVLNLRRRPDGDAAIVATIPPSGNRIRLTGYCVGDWCPIAHGRNSGWAHRNFLALEF